MAVHRWPPAHSPTHQSECTGGQTWHTYMHTGIVLVTLQIRWGASWWSDAEKKNKIVTSRVQRLHQTTQQPWWRWSCASAGTYQIRDTLHNGHCVRDERDELAKHACVKCKYKATWSSIMWPARVGEHCTAQANGVTKTTYLLHYLLLLVLATVIYLCS